MDDHLVGAQEVLDVVLTRATEGSQPSARHDPYRVALVIEGGAVRAAVTGGMALALYDNGLLAAFDAVYGSSAGAITGAWLTSSRPQGLLGWTEPAYTRMMISPHGPLRRRPFVDVKTLAEVVYTQLTPLDFASVLVSPVSWHPLATDARTGRSVDLQPLLREPADVQLAIRATAAIPLLAGGPVRIADRSYYDAGVAEPLPYPTAIAQGATHVLVLRSRRVGDLPQTSCLTVAAAHTVLRRHGKDFTRQLLSSSHRYLDADHLLAGRRPFPPDHPPILALRPSSSAPMAARFSCDRAAVTAAFDAGRAAVDAAIGARSLLQPV